MARMPAIEMGSVTPRLTQARSSHYTVAHTKWSDCEYGIA
jgi:hypothetical protein